MQRVGAILLGINSVLCSAIILRIVTGAVYDAWTTTGVISSAFGLGLVLLLLPTGIAHGLAAVFPQLLDHWMPDPNQPAEQRKLLFENHLRELYVTVG